LKAISDQTLRASFRPILIGPYSVFTYYNQRLSKPLQLLRLPTPDIIPSDDNCIPIWEPENLIGEIAPGKVTRVAGHIAGISIQEAATLAIRGQADALVTAPVSKEALLLDGFPSPGHTELLAKFTETDEAVSMILWEKLRVALYTVHRSFRTVADAIDRDGIVRKLRVLDRAMGEWFGISEPKIGLCGLNPHASDGGLFGREEALVLSPAVEKATREGIHTFGPIPADILFLNWQSYDCLMAFYHDQGVVPVTLLSKGEACYVSLGLPFLRVGPGHGTAFDIAGKMVANPDKMKNAIRIAVEMVTTKQERVGTTNEHSNN